MLLARYAAHGRDNNFNLMRMVAALMVLFSHSFALATGSGRNEPLRGLIGMTPGTIAVDIFFITSGYLVTRSIVSRKNFIEFLINRMLRIYPGLIVSIAATTVVLGLFFQPNDFLNFITSSPVKHFVETNCVSLLGTEFSIPGVFEDAPYKGTINGSLWTLPNELRMYASLALIWIVSVIWQNKRLHLFTASCLFVLIVVSACYYLKFGFEFKEFDILRLAILFYSESVFCVFSEKIDINRVTAIIFLVLIASSFFLGKHAFFATYMLLIPYIVMYLAYVPAGIIRNYNALGDYSYGVYIYAFPVQQAVSIIMKPIDPMVLFLYSGTVTLTLAVISWKIVEHPALQSKAKLENYFKTWRPVQS